MIDRLSRISYRLPSIVVLAAAISALAIGTFSYFESSKEVRHQATEKLVALRDARHATLERYFRSIEEDLALLAANGQVAEAMADFRVAFGQIDKADRFEEEQALRRIYTPQHTGGNRKLIRQAASAGVLAYFHAHNQHHHWFEVTTKLKGYYDLFLISPTGDVVYTMFKEQDFATNLSFGAWSETGLAKVFKAGMRADLVEASAFIDFEPYEPSAGAPAAFIGRKIIRGGQTLGLLVLQMPIGRINAVMQATAGMGETGETYVVGSDHLMRSNSRFSKEPTILKTAVRTAAADRALKGGTGYETVLDYRGVPVVSAFRPFTFKGAKWALLAEIDAAEVRQPIDAMRNSILLIGMVLTLLIAGGGMLVAASITRPLGELSDAITVFRQTRIAPELEQTGRTDEIGEIARGFDAAAREVVEYIDFINLARDELSQGESDLRDREERIRSLLEVSPIGFVLARFSGEMLLTNAALKSILGHGFKIGDRISAVDIYRNLEDRAEFVRQLKQDGEVSGFEAEWVRADGEPIWVTLNSKVIDYDNERAILTWVDDISERKRAQVELAKNEAVLRLSFDTMSDGIYVLNADLDYVFFNDQYVDMVNLPNGTIKIGQSVEHAIRAHAERGDYGEGDIDDLLLARLERLASPDYIHTEMQIDGGERIVDLRKASTEGGGAVVITRDITERKQAEAEIAQQKAMLEVTLETMDQGITMFDGDYRLTMYNSKAPAMLNTPDHLTKIGASFQDWYRHTAREIIEKSGATVDEAAIESKLAAQISTVRNAQPAIYERPTTDDRMIEIRRNPVDGGGFVSTFTDITERKKAERIIANAMTLINESINYASKIQRSLLPSPAEMTSTFTDHLVIWEPKDVVGGDIYHLRKCQGGTLLMVVDCTGHGVPGAFMTMIVTGALDQALIEVPSGDPAMLLTRINQMVKATLGQDGDVGESDDGFECGLCLIDEDAGTISYAGARFELWCIAGDTVDVVKGDKTGIGYRRTASDHAFTNHDIAIGPAVTYYIVTDGIVDQVGGEKRRAFGKRRVQAAILECGDAPLVNVAAHVGKIFTAYQGEQERRDDVTVVAFRP